MNNITALNLSFVRPFTLRWKFSLRAFLLFSLMFIAFLLVFYIFQVNEITKASFFISNYEKEIADFSQANKNLETDFSYLNSSANLETVLSNLNYEKIGKVHYIRVLESTAMAK